jgi:dienelactone hydrolase
MLVTLLVTALVCLGAGEPSGQHQRAFARGQLVENVSSETTSGHRHAVYVPGSYDPSRPAPILYLMDPRGRARVAARQFQSAAERFGYILISSYDSASDVPPEVNLRAIQAMWDDSQRWFAIDGRRVYVAGFSGTARVATLLAHNRPEAITGVIGAAAGFHPGFRPSKDEKFLYFGTVGDADYNYREVEALEQLLVSLDRSHRIERFQGPHGWMPPALAMQAVEWLELRAMQAGTRSRDESLIDALWQRDDATAREAVAAARQLDAARRYAGMVRDFAGLRDVAQVRSFASRSLATPEARNELKRRQNDGRKLKEWIAHVMQVISDAFPEGAGTPLRLAGDLAQTLEITRMKTIAAAGGDAGLEAQRRLNELEVQLGFYLPHEASRAADFSRAAYYLSLALQINDRSPVTWYLMAQTSAAVNGRRDALAALQRSVDAGFRDLALLEADSAFRKLRTEPGFQAIVEHLKAAGDSMDTLTVDRPPMPPLR